MLTDQVSVVDTNIYEQDHLNRKEFVGRLRDILIHGDKGIVLGLNGAWGTGKSTAITFLEHELRNSGHATIVLNAWADDYVSDPLISILANLATNENFKNLVRDEELIKKFFDIGKNVIDFAAAVAIARLSKGQLSTDDLTGITEVSTDLTDLIREYSAEKKSLTELKELLVKITAKLNENDSKRLVIIVDELDRCKPTYAIALFERIKHLLEVDNVRVLLSFDQIQLEATVKKQYGTDIDANRYLEKMFDLIVNLPSSDLHSLLKKTAKSLGIENMTVTGLHPLGGDNTKEFLTMLLDLLSATNSSPRELERILTKVKFLLTRENGLNIDPVFASVLLVLQSQRKDIFNNILNGESKFEDIDKYFRNIPSKIRYWTGKFSNYIETLYYIKQDALTDSVNLTHIQIETAAFQELDDKLKIKRQRMQAYIDSINSDRFGTLSEMAHLVDFVLQ